jgi:hypothetical protein
MGAATYPIDVALPGIAYAVLLQSTVTSGRIRHIAVDAAEPNRARDCPQTMDRAGSCRTGLRVPSLGVFHKQMIGRNVRCLQEPQDVFGTPVAQDADRTVDDFSRGIAFVVSRSLCRLSSR